MLFHQCCSFFVVFFFKSLFSFSFVKSKKKRRSEQANESVMKGIVGWRLIKEPFGPTAAFLEVAYTNTHTFVEYKESRERIMQLKFVCSPYLDTKMYGKRESNSSENECQFLFWLFFFIHSTAQFCVFSIHSAAAAESFGIKCMTTRGCSRHM
jgi:hypothetical protein